MPKTVQQIKVREFAPTMVQQIIVRELAPKMVQNILKYGPLAAVLTCNGLDASDDMHLMLTIFGAKSRTHFLDHFRRKVLYFNFSPKVDWTLHRKLSKHVENTGVCPENGPKH